MAEPYTAGTKTAEFNTATLMKQILLKQKIAETNRAARNTN